MMRFAVYLVGLVLVIAALWMLAVQTGISAIVPLSLIAVAILLVLGLGVMKGASAINEPIHAREVIEDRRPPTTRTTEVVEHRRRW